jgi:hypothetical protein
VISGFVDAGASGKYEVTVGVKNTATGLGDSVKLPLQVTAEQP